MENAFLRRALFELSVSVEEIVYFIDRTLYIRLGTFILGGCISDGLRARMGMSGRLMAQSTFLLTGGALMLIFFKTPSLLGIKMAYCLVLVFLHTAQASSTFAIIPYVNDPTTGFTRGIVGAGGSLGSYCFAQAFRHWEFDNAGTLMGVLTLLSAGLSALIFIPGQSSLFCDGQNNVNATENGAVVLPNQNNIVEDTNEDYDETHA
uniref:Major facilitator superfamily (MFS) profile domain-containing protein n=1 Tax=Amphora coffeiformis TaxID=265554 RepID=A0A7S3LIT7_9STRA